MYLHSLPLAGGRHHPSGPTLPATNHSGAGPIPIECGVGLAEISGQVSPCLQRCAFRFLLV